MNGVKSINVKGIASHMRHLKAEGRSTALLVGAGISVSAGIPLARTMAEELRNDPRYNYRFEDIASQPGDSDYNWTMRALTYKQREEYLRSYISKAKINLSHLIIGMLIKEGYVSSVLTTNFDPLLVKTMGIFNQHVYVYDLANIRDYVSDSIISPNIFYLHGQGHAFLMLNTHEELSRPKQYFQTLVNDMMRKHYFMVVGYSGLNDFIFNTFCSFPRFPSDLHWVGYKSPEPPQHVFNQLCNKDSVRYCNSYGADSFFRELALELNLTPAPFLDSPFQHLINMLSNVGKLEYDDGHEVHEFDILKQPLLKINTAIHILDKGKNVDLDEALKKVKEGETQAMLSALNFQGKYDQVIAHEKEIIATNNPDAATQLSWAYTLKGGAAYEQGRIDEGNAFYLKAQTLHHLPERFYYNWATDLMRIAERQRSKELFLIACEKCSEAVKHYEEFYQAYYNWGHGLFHLYNITGEQAYLDDSIIKYELANKYHPHIADYNLARVYNLKQDTKKALLLLESSLKNPLKTSPANRGEIYGDKYLETLYTEPGFTAILDKYFPARLAQQ